MKKKKPRTNQTSERKKKKENRTANHEKKGKKKSQKWSKVAAEYYLWVPYVYLITILSLGYE